MAYPSRPAEAVVFREEFSNPATLHANGGTLVGSPLVRDGLHLDGSTQYATFAIPDYTYPREQITIVTEFTPDFDYDGDLNAYIYDSETNNRYYVIKCDNSANNELYIGMGSTLVSIVAPATYGPHWRQGRRNVLVVTGEPGDVDVWLNGVQIVTGDTTSWTVENPTIIYIGIWHLLNYRFDGIINRFSVHSRRFVQADVDGVQDHSLFQYRNYAELWLDTAIVHEIEGPDLLTDGDMEAADTSAWNAINNATLTKEPGAPSGSGSQVLRVTWNGTTNPQASQIAATVGNEYRAAGYGQSEGSTLWVIRSGSGVNIYIGNTNAVWTEWETRFTAVATDLRLVAAASSAGYCEFDDVTLKEIYLQVPDRSGNAAHVRLGSTVASRPAFQNPGLLFDGADDYLVLPSDPTGDYTIVTKRSEDIAPTFENDLTTWNKIKTAGQFSGTLEYLIWFPFALSPIQQTDLEYALRGIR